MANELLGAAPVRGHGWLRMDDPSSVLSSSELHHRDTIAAHGNRTTISNRRSDY